MLKEFKFGPEATAYIRSQLSMGNMLSKYLLDLPLSDGYVTTFLPEDVSSVALLRFESGGIAKTRETEPGLLAFIMAYLNGEMSRFAVFETLAQPGDELLSSLPGQYFVHGTEVYYFLTSLHHTQEEMLTATRFARHYPFVGVLASISADELQIRASQDVVLDTLKAIARSTEHILIGAYDHESVLIWSKRRLDHGRAAA